LYGSPLVAMVSHCYFLFLNHNDQNRGTCLWQSLILIFAEESYRNKECWIHATTIVSLCFLS
jgi:hypothetical protein